MTIEPTTGWYYGTDLDWDGMPYWDALCDCSLQPDDDDDDYNDHECYCTIQYLGDWTITDDNMLEPDPDGEHGFAAIYDGNDNTLAVVWSKTLRVGNVGSPCIPGQASASDDDPEYTGNDDNLLQTIPGIMAAGQFAGPTAQTVYYGLPDHCIYKGE